MYTFYVEKGSTSLIKVEVEDFLVETDSYLKDLIEKCLDRVISTIGKDEKREEIDSSEEADLEDED